MPLNFHEFFVNADEAAARAKFERLVIQLAHLRHGAIGVLANPGDWGIDAFVGDLEGTVAIWQAKFFFDGVEDSQKAQTRASFAAAAKAAEREGYQVDAWTLAVPVDLDGDATKWWQRWRRREEKKSGVRIELWSLTHLEGLLLTPDARRIAHHFFPATFPATPDLNPEVMDLPEGHDLDEALFVRQLEAAEIIENQSAKRQFFNYEALARDVADKADPTETATLQSLEAEIHAIWEARFGAAKPDPNTGIDPELHVAVMDAIRLAHAASPATLPPMSPVHKMGTMHLIVNNGEAGWVSHFRKIAETYRA